MQYTIWVIPPASVYTKLKSTIDELAKTYNSPAFEPHMTLLGNIDNSLAEVEKKVKELAKTVDKLELSLGPVSFSTTYFQSVFIRVNSTAKLMQLNLDAKKLFGRENDVFMPHISLLYGDHDMTIREEGATKVQLTELRFVGSEFVIVPTTHDPNEWKHLATVPFGLNS